MLDRSDLHAYQTDQAIPHIQTHERCALWCAVGGGKTVFTLTALDDLSMVETDVWPCLVVTTKRVARSVWPQEPGEWAHLSHLTVSAVVGTDDERRAALRRKAHIYTINSENVAWLVDVISADWPFRTVVADESTRLKSVRVEQGSKNAGALRDVALTKAKRTGGSLVRGLSPGVRRFIELTGTPAPNGLKDLWGQTYFLDAGQRLGTSYTAFEQRWFRKGYDGYSLEPMPHAEAEIHAKLRDICLTVDVPPAPDPICNDIYVDLPPAVRRIYDDMEKKMYADIEEMGVEAFSAASKTSKCEQIANGAIYVDDEKNWKKLHDAKIEVLEDIIEESAGAPVLVGYQFRHDLYCLQRAFPKAVVMDDDPKTIERWNGGEIGILLAHPQSAGHGLNMARGGNILARFGFDWNLEFYDQIIGRIGPRRQMQAGFDRPVFDHRILARRTVDELKRDRVTSKRSVQAILMEAMKRRKGKA
jgi:hypothetical protein